jgi:tetratricopeptide (TPR) repeat protein
VLVLGQKRLDTAEVQTALAGAMQADFISEVQDKTYTFNHPLMQETIYKTLAFSQRQIWHSQIGDWLVAERPDSPLEVKVYHYLRGADGEKGAEFGLRAAQRAKEMGAYLGAVEYYEQLLALPHLSDPMQLKISEGLADVLVLQGDYATAQTAYLQALDLGSPTARPKFVLLSGDLATLSQTTFDNPELGLWASGAEAWLLAQNGQKQAALTLIEQRLPSAVGAVQGALEQIAQKIIDDDIGTYREWLKSFAIGFLAHPPDIP